MPNLDFVLMGHQDWDIQSVHTGLIVGCVQYNPGWHTFCFHSYNYALDATAMREIAKFLDEQGSLRGQR